MEAKQIGRVQAVPRAPADATAVEQALQAVRQAADTETNLMPLLVDARVFTLRRARSSSPSSRSSGRTPRRRSF
jgi:methylmalonyl-CoA mutase N-terminal domain/subunit